MEVAPSGFTVERIDCVVLRAFPDGEVLSGRNLAVKEVVRLSGLKLLKLCHSALLTVIVTLPSMPLPSLLPGSLRFSLTGSAPGLAAFRSISEQNTTSRSSAEFPEADPVCPGRDSGAAVISQIPEKSLPALFGRGAAYGVDAVIRHFLRICR